MKVYIVADITVQNPEAYQKYIDQVPATIAKHGGQYLVRAGRVTGESKSWKPQGRLVIIEFPNQKKYEEWKNSEEYQTIAKIRKKASISRSFLVEGIEPSMK